MVTVCPVLVGRDVPFGVVDALARSAAAGRGSTCVLIGEPGIGKTRLAAEIGRAAAHRGSVVLRGRSVPTSVPSPFRPIAEALSAVTRGQSPPDVDELAPFRGALGRLMPDWRTGTDVEIDAAEPLVAVAEGCLRLLRWLGRSGGCVVVLDDLHWSDPETRAVFEYLADNIGAEPVLLLGMARQERDNPMLELATRLESRRVAEIIELAPLPASDVTAMVAESGATLDRSTLAALIERSDGVPLLVEELLASIAPAGSAGEDGRTSAAFSTVPRTFAQSVSDRLAALDAATIQVLEAAAVIGEVVPVRVLASVLQVDADAVVRGLGAAEGSQLLRTDSSGEGGAVRFRHGLTRQAILDRVVMTDRVAWARRAAPEVERLANRQDASWRAASIELWIEAGDGQRAAELLLENAAEGLNRGALVSAEAALERAATLWLDGPLAARRLSLLTEVLALAGKTDVAARAGQELLAVLEANDSPPIELADVHLRLARVAHTEGRNDDARTHVGRARALVPTSETAHGSRCDAIEAHICLSEERLDDSRVLAQRAVDVAEREGLPEVACEALQALGRASQVLDVSAALDAHERAVAIATDHGLAHWRAKALRERGWLEVLTTGRLEPLEAARNEALNAGAMATAAEIDTSLAFVLLNAFRRGDALQAASRAVHAGRRYRLGTLSLSLLAVADAHAWSGRRREMEAAITEALAAPGLDPSVESGVWGDARAVLSLLEDDPQRALAELDKAMSFPLTHLSRNAPYPGLWALVRTVEDADGDRARDRLEADGATVGWMARSFLAYAQAVAAGRSGDVDGATRWVDLADSIVDEQLAGHWLAHLSHRLIAPKALRDHWGQPITWLRGALDFFDAQGLPGIAGACRKLLRSAGAPVPRRGRGDAEVPPELRAMGVTTREMDVLLLVAQSMSNADIAQRLHLSVRTVENHISRLLQKTALGDRRQLSRLVSADGAN